MCSIILTWSCIARCRCGLDGFLKRALGGPEHVTREITIASVLAGDLSDAYRVRRTWQMSGYITSMLRARITALTKEGPEKLDLAISALMSGRPRSRPTCTTVDEVLEGLVRIRDF